MQRLPSNPIIGPAHLPGAAGANINGPSLIRAPDWLPNRLGRYYLYFGHHRDTYIRLAFADELTGPWRIHPPGALHLRDVPACRDHISSPDVLVDADHRQLRLYFHGPVHGQPGQKTLVALSPDGLHFAARSEVLGIFYMRVFRWRDAWYGVAKGGMLYRSPDGLTGFEESHSLFHEMITDRHFNAPGSIRHVALHRQGDVLWVYFSRIGDAPERIQRAPVLLAGDWRTWRAGPVEEVLRPEMDYEGVNLPVVPSVAGAAHGPEHALRDPAIFEDADGRTYLVYSVAGESGLAIAELSKA
jgi:hypothetical protein